MRLSQSIVALLAATAFAAGSSLTVSTSASQATGPSGIHEASWAPDGRRLAVSWFDAIWTMRPDGRDRERVVDRPGSWVSERDPAWSRDGETIVFSADTNGEFDLWIVEADGGVARQLTVAPGDERWPSWTADGRVVYSHHSPGGVWQLFSTAIDSREAPRPLSPEGAAEWQGSVSPDGTRLVFVSSRDREDGDAADIWVRTLDGTTATPVTARVTRGGSTERHPVWAPDGTRVAYAAVRAGQFGVWVSDVPSLADSAAGLAGGARAGRGGGRGRAGRGPGATEPIAVLASRHGGVPAWSPDGETLAIASFSIVTRGYNGNPQRSDAEPPMMFAGADDHVLWRVPAPRLVDAGAAPLELNEPDDGRWTVAFDQVWQTLKSMYYRTGPAAEAWDAARAVHRPQMAELRDPQAAEAVIDDLIADQPLIKPALESTRAAVSSGHPLASAAGALMLEKGGNVVDAGIAVSFALGVVEPDASGLGGDGQAILFLRGMPEPVVIEYKDMTPGHATRDNPRLYNPDGSRTARFGPSVVNIPGTVAGLDLLYRRYGSGNVSWADVIAPAIELAEDGFILDEALPTTIATGLDRLEQSPAAARIFLPGGEVPKAGDRFVNRDYANTLRTLADEGGESFYRGTIAEAIAADMQANGGVITVEDLAQYRAMERKPLVGEYRGHRVFGPPPPVSSGLSLIETLQILDHHEPRAGATYVTDPDYLHHAIDAWRVRDGGARIADPERWTVDLGDHLDPGHALERFGLIDPERVYRRPGGGGRGGLPLQTQTPVGTARNEIQTGTTAFVVADVEGNMIAFTQTLSTWGGAFYVSEGLGFLYNDHFRGGRPGTGFGATLPLMRSSTTSVPTLVFAPDPVDPGPSGMPGFRPKLAVGAAGNAWITASVYTLILNVVDGAMTAQEAIEAPRMLIGNGAGGVSNVQIEDRFPLAVLEALGARGHTFTKVGRKGEVKYGYASLAVVNSAKGTVEGGAEPRRSHGTAEPGAGR